MAVRSPSGLATKTEAELLINSEREDEKFDDENIRAGYV
jgi:hypothetical protein